MAASFSCPKCRQSYALEPQVAGKAVRCRQCGNVFRAPTAAALPVAPPQSPTPPANEPPPLWPGTMRGVDRLLLSAGVALAGMATSCLVLLFPLLGIANAGAAMLMGLQGLLGAGLILYALRARLLIASAIAGGILFLLLAGFLANAQPGRRATPAESHRPTPEAPLAAAVVPVPEPMAMTNRTTAAESFVPVTSPVASTVPQRTPSAPLAAAPSPPPTAVTAVAPAPNGSATPRRWMSEVIGGSRDGASFESPFAAAPLTGLAYERGSWAGESGFARIEPIDPRSESWGLETVVAKAGYAIGGLKVDGGQVFHAMQLVFMRLLPDGRLDTKDTYTSDWIGTPKGDVQTVLSEGTPVVGVHGRRMLLVHALGLTFSSGVATALAAREPSAASAALSSVVLVEHPLASGSGFAVAQNIVATNAHVVDGAFPDEIKVQFGAENTPPSRVARILHFDRVRDLCLLEVDAVLPPLPIRGDYLLHPGDPVVLVGNPSVKGGMLLRNAINHGKLVTVMRLDGQDVYQIDVTVNPGWSGGPVLDAEGKVIAMVAMKVNDEAVAEVRSSLARLDDNYRTRTDSATATGITLSIPASALAKALDAPNLHDEERLATLNDRYAAQAVFERLNFLTNLVMLRMQINVPYQVRLEAQAFEQTGGVSKARMPRLAGAKVEYIRLMPAETATRLSQALKSPEVRAMEERFTDGLDARLDAVLQSPHIAEEVKRDLRNLARKIKEAGQYAERPAAGYAAFSFKVKGFSRDFKDLLNRVESGVEDKAP